MAAASSISVPPAPVFLDPLIEIDSCYYYAVPKFFSFSHPNTRWLIAMIKTKEEDRVKRKMELNPELFKGKYFQMMDYPWLYMPHDPSLTPMFKRQSVLYLSALGMSIYLRSLPLVDLILFHKDAYDEVVGNPNETQFASHLQDMKYGDFHAFPPCVIMLRMYCFECTLSLLQAGWNPTQALAMPMRRRYERRAFYFHDWLEAALGLLSERPFYPLQSLMLNMTRDMTLYKFLVLPITTMLPQTPKQRVPVGLIDVEDLPVGTRMIGVRSLLEMAKDYARYLQMRSCAQEVAALIREAVAVGHNPETLMMQAQDCDGFVADKEMQESGNNACRGAGLKAAVLANRRSAVQHDTRQQAVNANNSATAVIANANAATADAGYASEGCRVMQYAMEKDKSCKRLQVCLDSLIVMTKRGFYVNTERLPPEAPRARDIRNVVVLLLNMIQREQVKLDVIFAKIHSGYKKFQHLDEHKLLENRRLASVFNISKIIAVLTRLLLQSKELVYFVSAPFPPYPPNIVDIKMNFNIQGKFGDIKCGVVQEFNSIKDGWTSLNKEMMQEVSNIKSMDLHLKVGIKPTAEAILAAKKAVRKTGMRNKGSKNKSNTKSCFVTFKKFQRMPRRPTSRGCDFGESRRRRDSAENAATRPSAAGACVDSFDGPSEPDVAFGDIDDWKSLPLLPMLQEPPSDRESQVAQRSSGPLYGFVDGEEAADGGDNLSAGSGQDDPTLSDIVKECDSLSETGLLMSSLYRDVGELLRPSVSGNAAAQMADQVSSQVSLQASSASSYSRW